MFLKRALALISCFVFCSITFTGCQNEQNTEDSNNSKAFSAVLVTQEGGINDGSFNQSAWEGMLKAQKELGISSKYIDSEQSSSYLNNLENATDSKPDIVLGVGFKLASAMEAVSKANPTQRYGLIDCIFENDIPENIVCVVFKEEESAFLAGYLAVMCSKSGTIGFVGGMKNPIIGHFENGFIAGAKYAAAKNQKEIEILKQYANTFSDSSKCKDIAIKMFADGCDIIFHAAGLAGNGIIEAAKEHNKMVIGADMDQKSLAPNNVIASAIKCVDTTIYNIINNLMNGDTSKMGSQIVLGLADKAVDLVSISDNVNENVVKEIDKLKADIIGNKILVPKTENELNEFINKLKKDFSNQPISATNEKVEK